MAAELKGEWSTTSVTKSGVTSKTASYKINGKEVIKLTNLSSSLEAVDGKIDGLTVDEDNKTVTLSGSALNEQTVAFTSSTYTLALDNVPAVEFTVDETVVSGGKATFNGGWSSGYTLSANGKTLTYTAENSDQLLATVSGLATDATENDVVYEDGVITLSPDALKAAKVSLTLKNGAAFTLAIDDDVQKIEADGTWTVTNGTATLKGTVTQDGYAVAPDGKFVNYLKANANTATLATVKGLSTTYTNDMDVTTAVDENGNYIITLPQAALNAKDVTVSGTGYVLALQDGSVPTSETVEKTDEWTVSGTTATYNQVMPEHYDVSGAKVVYTKAATVQTYAKVAGLKSGLKVSSDKKTIQSDSTDVITVRGKVITLAEGALNNAGVTLTSDDYSLDLDDVREPVIDDTTGVWSLSGKNGGIYKAKITTGGWGRKDSKTVTYTAVSNSAVVGTITGLKNGVTKDELENIKVENGEFNVPADLLTNSDVTLTNGNGFGYSLATDANEAKDVHSWDVADTTDGATATANLYYGKSAYYVASDDGTTLAYNKPESGSSVATIQFLKAGTTAEDMPADDEITKATKAKNYTIPLSADVLTTKTVTLTGTGYALAIDPNEDLSAKSGKTIWELTDVKGSTPTATLSNYTTEGWAVNSGGTQIVYSAPVTGATIATLEGFKSGLKLNDDKTKFTSGIVVGDGDNGYEAGKIAIEKAAVGSSAIKLTSSSYKLVVGKDLTESEAERKWTTDNKGAAVYTYTTPAGYSISDNGKTFTATKKATVTATITGLGTNPTNITDLTPDDENKTITLSKNFLGTSDVTIKGAYKLAIDSSVKAPVVGNNTWDLSKKGTAVLKGQVTTAGYALTSDTTIAYTAPTDTSNQILATISGLNTTAGQTDTTGLEVGDGVITLSSNVLNKSKVTIKSDSYKLALDKTDEDLPLKKEDVTEWVVSSTTANYQTYTKGYYAMETKKDGTETGAIIYNKDGKATTLTTVKGLAKGTTIDTDEDYDDNTKTLTLNADQLGTSNVTLTGTGYSLALGSDVQKTKEETTEWVNSGTKATYQTYDKAYYTQSGNTITYNKPGKATVHLTLNGVADEVTDDNLNTSKKTITLNADQLNHKSNKAATKLTTSKEEAYQGYKIVLASGTSEPDSTAATWDVTNGKATYNQPIKAGNYVNDGTTVTYYNADTNITLATLSGLNKTSVTTSSFSGVKVKDGVITLTSSVLQTNKDDASTKVTVSKGYELALDSSVAKPEPTDPEWSFVDLEKKGTATYNNAVSAGYSIDSKGAVNYSAAKTTNTLATLSGLNKTSGYDNATDAGISVNEETGVITLSNADALTNKVSVRGTGYTVAVSSDLTPQTITDYTKGIWSLKGTTTATLSLGTSAGYVQDKNKTSVSLGKATVGDTVATLSGLGKNTKVDNGQLGTLVNKVFTQGVFIRSTGAIALTPAVLGTTDVVLTNAGDNALTISNENFTEPDIGERIWKYDASKGTATLYQTTTEGWTLNEAKTTLEYTANQDNAVLTTISGLSKTFEGDIDATVINTPENKNDTLTIEDPDLLGTSKVTIRNATGYTYALALGEKIPDAEYAKKLKTEWVTSSVKATLKTYKPAYYTLDKGAIVYNKPFDEKGKVYAEVSGIKKDVDISGLVKNNVITLGAAQLDGKTVTLTNKTVDSVPSEYTLVLGSDATKATPQATAKWVTGTSTTANLTASVSAGFTQTSDTKLTYTNDQPKAVLAVIKGVNKGAMDGYSFTTSSTTISPATEKLSKAVTIDGKETYGFKFASDYTGKITGASTADTITAAGAGVSIAAGAGDDSISISGGSASINAGKGDDSIKSGGGNNTFYYATGDGDDTIASFAQATDKIMTNAKANVIAIEKDGSNAVITIGAGTKNEGTITLTGKGSAIASISIVDTKGNAIEPSYKASSDVLLADDNYSTDAAALTDITDAFSASYTPYDFDAGLDLVKKDSFTPVVSYMGDDK